MVRISHVTWTIELASVFEKFGGIRPMAAKLGDVPPSTVKSWHAKRFIPAWRHDSILAAANKLGISVSPDELSQVRPDERPANTEGRSAA